MVSAARRAEVKRQFRRLRFDRGNPPQLAVDLDAALPRGKYFRIENGYDEPTKMERQRLAAYFGVPLGSVPLLSDQREAIAS